MKSVVSLIVALILSAGSVYAGDSYSPTENDPVFAGDIFDWSGFYAGLQGGFGSGAVRLDDFYCIAAETCGDDPDNRYFAEPETSGFKGGAHIGYNLQLGAFVLGAESDINLSDASSEQAPFLFYDASDDQLHDGNPGDTAALAVRWEGSARVKAGLALGRLMPYVTAGIAYGQAQLNVHRIYGQAGDQQDPLREVDFGQSVDLIGGTVGAGLAYAATDTLIVRGEARFTKYGDVVSADVVPGGDSGIFQVSGPTTFSVEGGISLKMGAFEAGSEEPAAGEDQFDWTGLYAGVQGGLINGAVRIDDYYCIAAAPPLGPCGGGGNESDDRYFGEPDLEGFRGGVHVGYSQQAGTLVFSAETDINLNNASSDTIPFLFYDASDGRVYDDRAPGETLSFAMDWDGSARVKAGLAMNRLMPFVTGGIAFGQAHADVHRIYGDPNDPNDPVVREPDFDHSINLIGVTVGTGVAYAATDNIIVTGEARLTKFGDVVSADIVEGGDSGIIRVSGPTTFSLEGGISFRF